MFGLLISVALVISPTLGRPQEPAPAAPQASPQQGGSTPIPIISQNAETKEDGGFSYSFETGNGIKVEETGTLKQGSPSLQGRSAAGDDESNNTVIVLQGSFSYTAPDGQVISLRYIADENGFQPEGEHIPTPPPGLEEALNALKQNLGGSSQPAEQSQSSQPQPSQKQPSQTQPSQTQPLQTQPPQSQPSEPEPSQPAPQASGTQPTQ